MSRQITLMLATAHKRTVKKWRNEAWEWSAFAQKCAEPTRTHETVAQYQSMTKDEQSEIKDCGGYVGAYLQGGERKNGAVAYRTLLTLDLDYGEPDAWEKACEALPRTAMLMYSTHKHRPEQPRYRLVAPLSRKVRPDEYEPMARRVAQMVGIDQMDHTTYQTARLFYWGSVSADGEWVFRQQEGEPLDVDAMLSTYENPLDSSEWPLGCRETDAVARATKNAEDPTEKPGLIGAFCRAYPIEAAIEELLADVYEPTAREGRYTYRLGSVAGGLVCYDGKWAYSHHETDPAGGMLCNAFDLVRVGKFGMQDENCRASDTTKLPSYRLMQEFAAALPKVKAEIVARGIKAAAEDFEGIGGELQTLMREPDSSEWYAELEVDGRGRIKSTVENVAIILEKAPEFRGRLWLDTFRGCVMVDGGMPWDKNARIWCNLDDANLRGWLEKFYQIVGKEKVKDGLDVAVSRRKRHPIREYLKSVKWDGVKRLERLIIDYIGAEDNELTRAITRKHFTAAVARVFEPGCKYDYCLILAGPQGVGKSTLIAIMGGEWYKDGLTSMDGKEGLEQVGGAWTIEVGEMDAIKRSGLSGVKQFLTARVDIFRPAYGVRLEHHPRQCVFFGTTNEERFLKDESGNRRFPIIAVDPALRKHGDHWFDDLKASRDQLWAEAVYYYEHGEELYLDMEMEAQMRKRQTEYDDNADDPLCDLLRSFLDTPIPIGWDRASMSDRRAYYEFGENGSEGQTLCRRDRFCIAEFLCERMGMSLTDSDYKYKARKVGRMMSQMEGWEKVTTSRHTEALYGIQKAYKRIESEDEI